MAADVPTAALPGLARGPRRLAHHGPLAGGEPDSRMWRGYGPERDTSLLGAGTERDFANRGDRVVMRTCDYGCCPRHVLDWCCGVGGAAKGLQDAWPHAIIIGVDLLPQPRYPYRFLQADATTMPVPIPCSMLGYDCGQDHGLDGCSLGSSWAPDFVWISAPCQRWSSNTACTGRPLEHPDLITPLRERVRSLGVAYIMENVPRAPLINPILICGVERGLRLGKYVLRRHRLFESNLMLLSAGCACRLPGVTLGVYGGGTSFKTRNAKGGRPYKGTSEERRRIMGIPWGNGREVSQAIPPAYSEFLARQIQLTSPNES